MNLILDKLEIVPEAGCWIYTGDLNRNGYGTRRVKKRRQMVHRLIYEHFKGPIPDGYVIDHLCRVRCCCNPDHLEAVTVKENTKRGKALLFCPHEVK